MNVDGEGLGRVLLVAPEQVGLSVFREEIESLIRRRKLNRVVVDEAAHRGSIAELPRMHGAAEERV